MFINRFAAYATLKEDNDAFTVKAFVPGLDEKALELQVTEDELTLKGKRETEAPKGYTAHRRERASYEFARTFEFATKVDPEKVTAVLEQGVLTITVQKAAAAKARTIAIKAAA